MRLFSTNYRLLITGAPLQFCRTISTSFGLYSTYCCLRYLVLQRPLMSGSKFLVKMINMRLSNSFIRFFDHFFFGGLNLMSKRVYLQRKKLYLKVGMSQMQKQYYQALLQKDLEVINAGGERKRLLNIAMRLRKCCNHPYLFHGAEPGPPYTCWKNGSVR